MDNKPINVLLIEDNPGDARLIQEMLIRVQGEGLNLTWVDRLSKGLESLSKGGVDIVLLDLSLPDSQGLETFTTLYAQTQKVPIIVQSGLIDEALAVSAVQEGAQDYLVKGQVDSGLLIRAIHYAIERKKAEEELKKKNKELESTNKQLKQTQAQLIQAAKMAAMGELGAGIAHELNQPLGGIKGFTELILEELDEKSPLREDLLQIEKQADRMAKIVRNISTFARQATFEYSPLDINTPLEQALMLISQQFRDHKIELVKDLDPNLPKVKADANQLQQVFLNIISNARDALDATDKENKKLTIITKPSSSFVEITFTDNGCGIGKENLNKIFDPFFTTKSVGRGTGLGLSVTYGIIKDHSGLLDISSAKNRGTVVRILFPTIESKPCWEIKKCPKDTRDRCLAFKENKGYLCWTIGGICCKQKVKEIGKSWIDICKECEIYQEHRIPSAPKPPKVRTFG